MLKNELYFIDSCDDVELGIRRTSKLEYRISYDDQRQMRAIVFIIGGHGANEDIDFLDQSRYFLTTCFNVVSVVVFYQCFASRPSRHPNYNPKIIPRDLDLHEFKIAMSKLGIKTDHIDKNNYFDCFYHIDKELQKQDCKNLYFYADLIPPNNEYQNYGIMAAIDHINALKHIMKNFPQFKNLPKIYGGGSYGAYLALLIAKIAPWHVDALIDNSAEALPILQCIIGRDMNVAEFVFNGQSMHLLSFVKNFWTRKNEKSPFFFKDEFYLIRSLLNPTHLLLQYQKNPNILVISYHSYFDRLTPAKYKIQLMNILKNLYDEVKFHLIDSKDWVFVKNLEHCCGIENDALFEKELPFILKKFKNRTFCIKDDSISYPCKDRIFVFKDRADSFVLELF